MPSEKPTNIPAVAGYRVWYSDRDIKSTVQTWDEMPVDDVQYVNVFYNRKIKHDTQRYERRIMHGMNRYSKDGDEFHQTNGNEKLPGTEKNGTFADDANAQRIRNESWNDYGKWLDE